MNITFIVPHFPPHVGGGEQLYYDVCTGLVQRGHNVRVVTSSSGGVSGHRKMGDIDVWYCDWKLFFGHPIVCSKDIKEHVRWSDIVHTAIYSTAPKSVSISKKYSKPCVVTIHEVMGDKWSWFEKNAVKASLFRLYENHIINSAENVHVVSHATKRDYLKFSKRPGNIFMIYNFLDLPSKEEIKSSNINFRDLFSLQQNERGILYFGRPAPNKGIFVLIEAIKIFREKYKSATGSDPDMRFCMILSPHPVNGRERVNKLIKEYDLADIVRIHEPLERKDLLKVVSESDLCVIPSVTEGFGYSACEACYYKRPVISSDGGSLPEVVSGTSLFFENKNAGDLADKLMEYAVNGCEYFEAIPEKKFEKEMIIDEYIKMYESLLGMKKEGL